MTKFIPSMILALALAACANTAPPSASNVTRVVSTTSFGMCVGYCSTRLEISEGQAVLIRDARGGRGSPDPAQPQQRFTAPLTPAEWQEIQRLAANVDMDALPEVVGCPDCADGGAEGLIIQRSGREERVSFDYGGPLPQAQQLVDRTRALRERLMPTQE